MVEADFGGDFLNYDSTKDGDIFVITGEGEYGELEFQGKKKRVLNIPVELNGRGLTYTPGMKAGKALVKAFGKETKSWVGKRVQVLHIEDKMVIRPIIEERV